MTLHPCGSCPYRKDVPSGVWAKSEYDKLPEYDNEMIYLQPTAAFFCHQQTGSLCAGWVGCHDMDNSLGLRFALVNEVLSKGQYLEALEYECPIPLWESGKAARDHGVAEVLNPGNDALRVVKKLHRKVDGLKFE
jgi:hypothetical protein